VKRVLISVEGQTEETFIRDVLSDYFVRLGIYLISTLVTTKIVKSGPDFKGGLTSYAKAKRDILRLLQDSDAIAITTMYDLYGLPTDFPGYNTRPVSPYEKVKHLETTLSQEINHPRFRPYIQLHEFETFLFVDPQTTALELRLASVQAARLTQIKTGFANPEEINDNPLTAPSKRILGIYPAYDKTFDGPLVTSSVGLDQIRASCPHFNEWITWLANL
jgi:hypothetical protein